jgi:hypothetical protein
MPLLGTVGASSVKSFGGLANLGYFIKNSLRFRRSANGYLNRTPASSGNSTTWTWSVWFKRGEMNSANAYTLLQAGAGSTYLWIIYSADQIYIQQNPSSTIELRTTQVFRDPSAWYHVVVTFDTTQATSSNRVKVYVNGSQVTSLDTSTYPSQNAGTIVNSTVAHYFGSNLGAGTAAFDGYMAEVNLIDGQALTPSSFGKTDPATGQWIPRKFAGTYGTNGFYLKFADASAATAAAIGKDSSPNGNNWTPNNISVTAGTTYDAMIDSPTLSAVASNFAVLNPLDIGTSTPTVSNANLRVVTPSTGGGLIRGTIGVSSGKWYWEATLTSQAQYAQTGITSVEYTASAYSYLESVPGAMYFIHGNKGTGPTGTNVAYGSTVADGDVVGVALDMDAGTLTFYKNGVSMGIAFTSISGTYLPSFGDSANSISSTFDVNFGQRPFAYTIPSGFKSLNTYNLP